MEDYRALVVELDMTFEILIVVVKAAFILNSLRTCKRQRRLSVRCDVKSNHLKELYGDYAIPKKRFLHPNRQQSCSVCLLGGGRRTIPTDCA